MMQVGPCSALGDPEELADLRVFEAFNVVQDNDRALSLSQQFQRRHESQSQLGRLRRIPEWRSQGLSERIGVPYLLSSSNVERCVCNDSVQPRTERLIREKSVERPVRVQEAFLHGVLGVFMREDD